MPRRLAELAAAERQACVERAEEAFVSADRGNSASMLRPIQLLAQGVGGKELEVRHTYTSTMGCCFDVWCSGATFPACWPAVAYYTCGDLSHAD